LGEFWAGCVGEAAPAQIPKTACFLPKNNPPTLDFTPLKFGGKNGDFCSFDKPLGLVLL